MGVSLDLRHLEDGSRDEKVVSKEGFHEGSSGDLTADSRQTPGRLHVGESRSGCNLQGSDDISVHIES